MVESFEYEICATGAFHLNTCGCVVPRGNGLGAQQLGSRPFPATDRPILGKMTHLAGPRLPFYKMGIFGFCGLFKQINFFSVCIKSPPM